MSTGAVRAGLLVPTDFLLSVAIAMNKYKALGEFFKITNTKAEFSYSLHQFVLIENNTAEENELALYIQMYVELTYLLKPKFCFHLLCKTNKLFQSSMFEM